MKDTNNMSYKEINTQNPNAEDEEFEIELEVVGDAEDEEFIPVPAEEEEEEAKPKGKKKEKPKADPRIKQLENEREEARELARQLAARLNESEKVSKTSNKQSKETLQASLTQTIDTLNERLIKAIEDGDAPKTVDLQKQINKAMLELAKVEHEVKSIEETPEVKQVQVPTQPKVSEKAQAWVAQYPEFYEDDDFRDTALAINQTLINRGMNPDTDVFYETLTKRLEKIFPDIFNDEAVEDEEEEVVPKTKTKKPAQQVVSGASRFSDGGKPSNKTQSNKTKVVLTESERKLADLWGISYAKFAKQKYEASQSTERGQYTPLFSK